MVDVMFQYAISRKYVSIKALYSDIIILRGSLKDTPLTGIELKNGNIVGHETKDR